jgi:hypothetical protein
MSARLRGIRAPPVFHIEFRADEPSEFRLVTFSGMGLRVSILFGLFPIGSKSMLSRATSNTVHTLSAPPTSVQIKLGILAIHS